MSARAVADRAFPRAAPQEREHRDPRFDRKLASLIWRFARPHRRYLWMAVALLPPATALQLVQPWLVMKAIDGPIARGDGRGLVALAAFYLVIIGLDLAVRMAQTWVIEQLGQRVVHDARVELFSHIEGLHSAFFERNPVGKLITRVTSDLEGLAEFFSSGLILLIQDLFLLAGILAVMWITSPPLTLATFSVVPPMFLLATRFRRRMRRVLEGIRHKIAGLNAYLQESLSGIETIKLFTREEANRREFDRLNADHRDAYLEFIMLDATLFALVEFIAAAAIALFIGYGAGQAALGAVSFGVLVGFLEYVQRFFIPLRDISQKFGIIQQAFTSAERIHDLLETRNPIAEPAHPRAVQRLRGRIEFDRVVFAYRPGEPVLKGVSFTVEAGRTAAFVGATGAGKSTIFRLLGRYYEPQEGAIRIDGVDIREYDAATLRRNIGQVLQDVFLFSGTVADNIALGRDLPLQTVRECARIAQADGFIERRPGGYGEVLPERGSNLSFGEKQLIAFARVLAKDPPLFVLDEATSNIDAATEALLQRGLLNVSRGRTALIIAHRLSTITHADRIHVLHHGEIVEEGTHEELMARRGHYWRLHQLQFRESTGGSGPGIGMAQTGRI